MWHKSLVHSSGHIVWSDTSVLCIALDILWGVTPARSDRPWEKHTQVTERPLRSVQGLSLHIDTPCTHRVFQCTVLFNICSFYAILYILKHTSVGACWLTYIRALLALWVMETPIWSVKNLHWLVVALRRCQAYEHKVHAQFTHKSNEHAHGMSNIFEHKVRIYIAQRTPYTQQGINTKSILCLTSLYVNVIQGAGACTCERELALLFSQICDIALEISCASCAHGSLCPVSDAH